MCWVLVQEKPVQLASCWWGEGRICGRLGEDDRRPVILRLALRLGTPARSSLTFWLLNVSTTLSAPSFVSKTSSAMTLGLSEMIRQFNTFPPTGVMALSISAAVVPRARFLIMTIDGPASPRIDIPGPGFAVPTILNWLFREGDEAEPWSAE